MPLMTLGKVSVPAAGTPVQLTATQQYKDAIAAAKLSAQFVTATAVLIQAADGNTGKTYVGKQGMVKATLAGVNAVLVAPTDTFIPSFGIASQLSPAGVDLSEIWFDAATNGEGVLVSLLYT